MWSECIRAIGLIHYRAETIQYRSSYNRPLYDSLVTNDLIKRYRPIKNKDMFILFLQWQGVIANLEQGNRIRLNDLAQDHEILQLFARRNGAQLVYKPESRQSDRYHDPDEGSVPFMIQIDINDPNRLIVIDDIDDRYIVQGTVPGTGYKPRSEVIALLKTLEPPETRITMTIDHKNLQGHLGQGQHITLTNVLASSSLISGMADYVNNTHGSQTDNDDNASTPGILSWNFDTNNMLNTLTVTDVSDIVSRFRMLLVQTHGVT